MAKWTNFQPYVMVADDGRIDIDWSDTYVNTIDEETGDPVDDDSALADAASDVLDQALGGTPVTLSQADQLRALADYIDAQGQ